jgi:hypothetical protein
MTEQEFYERQRLIPGHSLLNGGRSRTLADAVIEEMARLNAELAQIERRTKLTPEIRFARWCNRARKWET